ncbi:hypothetical protein [Ralstonia phage RP31]|uniref:Uncharacterized protein n=2 Tax=Ripduovirus RP12 TaxID=2560700 RepID=A0A1L7N0K7_9CAUD|nr:hypothetical protein FDH28_gp019 [Ralstonia phage RP12]BAW18993.1 hypothetical protein [Ralstonia phage RP12]BAW19281.1 hypothetical protein [Ralstonia phage RP31]
MAKVLSRVTAKKICQEAQHVAYMASLLFKEHHKFELGYADAKKINPRTINGYQNYLADFVPLSDMVLGKALKNKEPLRAIRHTAVERMIRQSFVGGKAWANGDVQVTTKDFMRPILDFLAKWGERLETYAGIYENKFTGTNVFGIYVKLVGDDGFDHLSWEITIDDVDLVKPMAMSNGLTLKTLFK